jgi:hypothetical protein
MNNDDFVHSLVAEFRLVTLAHLSKLKPQGGTRRNLKRLEEAGKIHRLKPTNRCEHHVFSTQKLDRKSRERLPHDLLITDIHVELYLTGLLKFWEQGKTAWKGNIHQDAFSILEHPRMVSPHNNFHFFIEADSGVEDYQEIGEKIQLYSEYPDKPFRVLFVTSRAGWAQRLAKAMERYVDKDARKFYFFAQATEFLANPLGPVCHMPFEEPPADEEELKGGQWRQKILPKLL